MIEEKTLEEIVEILGTRLNCNETEVWIDKFNLVELNHFNVCIALYAIAPTIQEAKELLAKKMSGKFLMRSRRFDNDICPVYPMPEKINV